MGLTSIQVSNKPLSFFTWSINVSSTNISNLETRNMKMSVHFRDLFHDFSIKERYVLSTSCATFDYHSAQSVEAIQPRDYSVETISPLPPPLPRA